jgi:predicted transcriptional regulator
LPSRRTRTAALFVKIPDDLHAALSGLSARTRRPMSELVAEGMTPYVAEMARSAEVKHNEAQFARDIERLVELANKMTRQRNAKRNIVTT